MLAQFCRCCYTQLQRRRNTKRCRRRRRCCALSEKEDSDVALVADLPFISRTLIVNSSSCGVDSDASPGSIDTQFEFIPFVGRRSLTCDAQSVGPSVPLVR
ncbi:hypothetical protein ACLKA6_016806 [Drosophila palustris]